MPEFKSEFWWYIGGKRGKEEIQIPTAEVSAH